MSAFIIRLYIVLFGFLCCGQVIAWNVYNEKRFFEDISRIFEGELLAHDIYFSASLLECPDCEIEEEVCLLEFNDVISMLKTLLSLNENHKDANYLLGRIYWMKSYVGEGFHDMSDLNIAHQLLKKVSPNKELNAVKEVMNGKYTKGGCSWGDYSLY